MARCPAPPLSFFVTLRRLRNGQLLNTPRKMPLACRQPVFSSACLAVDLRPTPPRFLLLTDAQLGDDGTIALDVLGHQVVQHLAALTDHLQQAAAAVVVVLVDLQVLGQLLDAGVGWVRLASITAVFSSLRIMVGFHLSSNVPAGCVTGRCEPGDEVRGKARTTQAMIDYHIFPVL